MKQASHSLREFASCLQQGNARNTAAYTYAQCDKLTKLSSALQQNLAQLQKLSGKDGIRKVQREKLQSTENLIKRELDKFQASEQKAKQVEASCPQAGVGSPSNTHKPASDGPSGVKVQWDQVLREEAEDNAMLEEFICKICQVHMVGSEPKLARCSHLFCGDCIAKWFEVQPQSLSWSQRAQSKGCVPCPVCKEPLHHSRDLFPVCAEGKGESAILWRMLSGTKILCANNPKCRADGKCTWMGEYGSYQKHIQACTNVALETTAFPSTRTLKSVVEVVPTSKPAPQSTVQSGAQLEPAVQLKLAETVEADPILKAARSGAQPEPVVQLKLAEAVRADSILKAVRAFTAGGPSQLDIKVGESIQVLNKHTSGWTYGRKGVSEGWFPQWVFA